MAKYYLEGYTPPEDVTSSDRVKDYQRFLGVTVDGIWGPKTQAAYDKVFLHKDSASTQSNSNSSSHSNSSSSSIPNSKTFLDYYNSILSSMTIPSLTPEIPSESKITSDISAYLRPAYDNAIANREKAGKSNMAEIDADAYSRGMGSSTFVTSVKSREQDDVSDDILMYETDYAATLAKSVYDAMSSYRDLAFEAEKFNAQAKQEAMNTAFSTAKALYSAFLEQQALAVSNSSSSSTSSGSSSSSGSSKSSSSSSDKKSNSSSTEESPRLLSFGECVFYLSNLTKAQLKLLVTSTTEYWTARRERLFNSLGEDYYMRLLGPNGEFSYLR